MRVYSQQEFALSPLSSAGKHTASAGNFQAVFATAAANQRSGGNPPTTATTKADATAASGKSTALAELEEYLRKSPAEHMREAILKRMGLSEADLAAMPPEQRLAVEDSIAKEIKEWMLGRQSTSPAAAGEPASLSIQSLLAPG